MKIYQLLGILALLALVVILPIYAQQETSRMDGAKASLQASYVQDAAQIYLEDCSLCHGLDGKGLGAMPPLNDPTLAEQDTAYIYNTIAHSPHGSAMASWHIEEGGVLNSYQVEGLVTLISTSAWDVVTTMADETGMTLDNESLLNSTRIENLAMSQGEANPHECRSCHEQPEIHADRFGLNCAYCHSLMAWKPAMLSRHVFRLNHGGAGNINCQTCHVDSYMDYTCYGCHDHLEDDMVAVHHDIGIVEDIADCALCHPTGDAGEAESLLEAALPSVGIED